MLLTTVLTVTTEVINKNVEQYKSLKINNSIIIILSLFLTFLIGLNAFLNPMQKWRQSKDAALSIESEIFKFRTRVGKYKVINNKIRKEERNLKQ